MKVRLASKLMYDSIVDGPGLRMVIWTQGCPHKCPGCHNPKTHNFEDGQDFDVESLVNQIKNIKWQDGITFSGGEPFEQAKELSYIAKEAKKLGLNLWAYSGYTIEQLMDKNHENYNDRMLLLQELDVLVDGKFIKSQKDISLKFRGSANQRVLDVKETLKSNQIVLKERFYKDEKLEVKAIKIS